MTDLLHHDGIPSDIRSSAVQIRAVHVTPGVTDIMLLADAAIGGHSGSSGLQQRRSWLASHIAAIQALDQATLQRARATVARSRQVLCQADRSLAYLKSAASVLASMIDVGDSVGLGSATPPSEPVVSVGSSHGENNL